MFRSEKTRHLTDMADGGESARSNVINFEDELDLGQIPEVETTEVMASPPPPPPPQPQVEARVPVVAPVAPPPVPAQRTTKPRMTNITRRSTADKTKRESIKNKSANKLPAATDAKEWIQFRVERPLFYTVSPDGGYYAYPLDLSGKRQGSETIQPSTFYRASLAQIQESYKRRRMDPAVLSADNEYIQTRMELLGLYREYKEMSKNRSYTDNQKMALRNQLIQANNKHGLSVKARSRAYGGSPYVEELDGSRRPFLFEVLPDEAIDKTSPFRDTMYMCRRSNFPVTDFYTDTLPIVEEAVVPASGAAVSSAAPAQQGGERVYSKEQMQIIARKKIAAWRTRKAGRF